MLGFNKGGKLHPHEQSAQVLNMNTQLLNLKQCKPLEKEFVESLASALEMESSVAVQMMFRIDTSPRKPTDLNHIRIQVSGQTGESIVRSLISRYGITRYHLNFSPKGRARGSVHRQTGRTPGARGFVGGDYNIHRDFGKRN